MRKTKKQWDKSWLQLDEFIPLPCEIDEELYNYIWEVVWPSYINNNILQWWEARWKDTNWVPTYDTVSFYNDRYFYLWVLPAFKTEED